VELGNWYAETGLWAGGNADKRRRCPYELLGISNTQRQQLRCDFTKRLLSLLSKLKLEARESSIYSPSGYKQPPTYDFGTGIVLVPLRVVPTITVLLKSGLERIIGRKYLRTILANAGAYWTQPFVDLTSYAGQTVQLALHMVAASFSSGAGWYVDDIQVFPYTILYPVCRHYWPRHSGNNLVVSWPIWATNFSLQISTNLSSGNWVAVTNSIPTAGIVMCLPTQSTAIPPFPVGAVMKTNIKNLVLLAALIAEIDLMLAGQVTRRH